MNINSLWKPSVVEGWITVLLVVCHLREQCYLEHESVLIDMCYVYVTQF